MFLLYKIVELNGRSIGVCVYVDPRHIVDSKTDWFHTCVARPHVRTLSQHICKYRSV